MGIKLQCLCSRSAATAVFTLLGCGPASLTKTQDGNDEECRAVKTWPLGFETDRQDPWPQSLQTETLQFEPGVSDECIFPFFLPLHELSRCAQTVRGFHMFVCFFPIGALTVSLRFPLYLSGCKSSSSSSSVWCQQCWLIKAVGRQCVIHSYSWHMYYSRLNTYN